MKKLRTRTRKVFRTAPERRVCSRMCEKSRLYRAAAGSDGAQLLEFALSLPFLLVFLVGIIEFGGAYNLKQKEANAAREGARIAVSNSLSDITCMGSNPPCAIQAAAKAVENYMTNAGVDSSCIDSASPSSTGFLTWTYTCGSGISLTINREYGYTYTPSGGTATALFGTQVTVTYPYSWTFNNVIKLLVPGSNLDLPTRLTESAVMKNLVTN